MNMNIFKLIIHEDIKCLTIFRKRIFLHFNQNPTKLIQEDLSDIMNVTEESRDLFRLSYI